MATIWIWSWFAQSVTGWSEYNAERLEHEQPSLSWLGYLGSADFWQTTLQNWQSEFLAVGSMAVLAIYLRQRGSPESKPVGCPHRSTSVRGDDVSPGRRNSLLRDADDPPARHEDRRADRAAAARRPQGRASTRAGRPSTAASTSATRARSSSSACSSASSRTRATSRRSSRTSPTSTTRSTTRRAPPAGRRRARGGDDRALHRRHRAARHRPARPRAAGDADGRRRSSS